MTWVDKVKTSIPDYAKDIRLNLDSVINRSSLSATEANGVALAAAIASGNKQLASAITESKVLDDTHTFAVKAAASLMAMNNVYYPFTEMANDSELKSLKPELRMSLYANFGGVDKKSFEMYALAASIIGKCHFCVESHYALLKKEGMTTLQLRDVARIASIIAAVAKCTEM
jgi:alkyl hydroperoxide reductase subunit D